MEDPVLLQNTSYETTALSFVIYSKTDYLFTWKVLKSDWGMSRFRQTSTLDQGAFLALSEVQETRRHTGRIFLQPSLLSENTYEALNTLSC